MGCQTYCKALKVIVNATAERIRLVKHYCREGHFHAYGDPSHATTATTEPPPIPSVLLRGEWTLGKVLDLYWKFAELGDYYLGRTLAFLDPDSETFGVLPPHFTAGTENPHINEAVIVPMVMDILNGQLAK